MRRTLTAAERRDRELNERDLGQQLLDIAHAYGWRAVHWRHAANSHGHWATNYQGDGEGFPDWLLLKGEQLVVAELERELSKCPPVQVEYLRTFANVRRVRSFVWRPRDRPTIIEVLSGQERGLPLDAEVW